ncbi:MAG: class I SAM-dependent methyltransferase [Phycisphaerae bacterium]|nr:class I SAM-dependent methyltransferase [Phycisphaerae bacterium]MDD5380275.1 class I SAM-dependent methyltransferase [Phycisphaerae bacterium]
MDPTNKLISNLYSEDEYIAKNPLLHKEDSSWKVSKIIPFIDIFAAAIGKKEINLLDVGGGAGLILNAVARYIKEKHQIKVNKFALDLSPGMLELQKKENPDLQQALNENINKTSFHDKQIDLTLMIDVLEHVLDPEKALEELRRISAFVLFKVPLENNLFLETLNLCRRGEQRKKGMSSSGHINFYNFRKLKCQIEQHMGQVTDFCFTNVFDYYLKSDDYKNKLSRKMKLLHTIASNMFKISPKLCSLFFTDFAMMLAKCD